MRPKSCLQSGKKVDDVLRSPVEGEAHHNAETGFSFQKFYLMCDCLCLLLGCSGNCRGWCFGERGTVCARFLRRRGHRSVSRNVLIILG